MGVPRVCIAALALLGPLATRPGLATEVSDGSKLLFPVSQTAASVLPQGTEPRRVTASGPPLTIPFIASAEQSAYGRVSTVFEVANVTDSEARFSIRVRGADGTPLEIPYLNASCPLCEPELHSAFGATISAHTAVRVQVAARNPPRFGWAEFATDPEVAFAVSALLQTEETDGTVSLVGIPPTSTQRKAWLYIDHNANPSTDLILVNPDSNETQSFQVLYRDSTDRNIECQATSQVSPSGQKVINLAESLPCSVGNLGVIEIQGQGEFTGIAFVSGEAGESFARQLTGQIPTMYPTISEWTIAAGHVGFGSPLSAGCLTLAKTQIEGSVYSVHVSNWQRRTHAGGEWTDVPGTRRIGQICPYSPVEPGEYRAVAEITIGDRRGTFASNGILTIAAEADQLPSPIPGLSEHTNSLGMQFVRVPAGEFSMGATGAWAYSSEVPVTQVRISEAFWIGKHEVTQGQWQAVMGDNPSHFAKCGLGCPVESVSWNDVQSFITKLNGREDEERYRLPTEAEWEYAARAGNESDTFAGDLAILGNYDAPRLDAISWYGGNSGVEYEGGWDCSVFLGKKQYPSSHCGPHPVGQKAPNQFALHDMLGNVWEWVQDWHSAYPGGTATDPTGPESGSLRIARGGSWSSAAASSRSARRALFRPDSGGRSQGLRLVRVNGGDPIFGGTPPTSDEYTLLNEWRVSDGQVQFVVASSQCLNLSNTTLNGVTYTVYSSKWQRRADPSATWADLPSTENEGGVCPYSPSEPGQYRGIAEISVNGVRGEYSTNNVLTVGPTDSSSQVVNIVLGNSGDSVTITRTEDGSYQIGATQFASGETVTASNGSRYRLTLGADGIWTAAPVTQTNASLSVSVSPTGLTLAQAGKPGTDSIIVTVQDDGGTPVAGARCRWSTDRNSGWVYPSEGVTDELGRFETTWVAGWPGPGTLVLTVEHEGSQVTEELETLSAVPSRPPNGALSIWSNNRDNPSSGYSIDMTPLTEPTGTYYAAIQWDGGYTGLQRGGSRYDRQLQFSVWDAPGYGGAELVNKEQDVQCRTFGGEGTGVACELNYPWKVGSTYRFEVTEEEMNGGSAITLHVTDLATRSRRYVGTIRFARRAEMTSFAMFVEDFVQRAEHCLAREVRSAAIRRPRAFLNGAWVALEEMTHGYLSRWEEDPWNPGTPGCANLAAREHAAGLEIAIGGETASDPNAPPYYTIPID